MLVGTKQKKIMIKLKCKQL